MSTFTCSENSAHQFEISLPFRSDETIEQIPESLPGIGALGGNDTTTGWWVQNTGKYVKERTGLVSTVKGVKAVITRYRVESDIL